MIGAAFPSLDGMAAAATQCFAEYGVGVEITRSPERRELVGIVSDTTGLRIESRFSVPMANAEQIAAALAPALHAAVDAVIGARMDALMAAHYGGKP